MKRILAVCALALAVASTAVAAPKWPLTPARTAQIERGVLQGQYPIVGAVTCKPDGASAMVCAAKVDAGTVTVRAWLDNAGQTHTSITKTAGVGKAPPLAGAPYRTEHAASQYLTSFTSWKGIPLVQYGIKPVAVCTGAGPSITDSAGEQVYRAFACHLISGDHDFAVITRSLPGGKWFVAAG